jgi:hypothetical protein
MARILITHPSRGAPTNPQEQAHSPECVEQEFFELRLYEVLGSSHAFSADGIMLGCGMG